MAHRRHGALTIAIASLILALLPSGVTAADPQAAKPSDFNGDGYADLAIGVRRDDVKSGDTGGVNVLYGSATGLTAQADDQWALGRDGLPGGADGSDLFGEAVASGDFDRDGYADLAVSAGADNRLTPNVGSVTIIYGSAAGLSAAGSQLWTEDAVGDLAGYVSGFGVALAAGDLDGDGFADLAVGAIYAQVDAVAESAVDVFFGGPDGLSAAGAVQITQDSPGVPGELEDGNDFGGVLFAADLSGDAIDDLVVGMPGAGSVIVLYGTSDGPTGIDSQQWTDATPEMPGDPSGPTFFGAGLAAGDFDRDGFGDLAIGAPFDVIGRIMTGSIVVIRGSDAGLILDGLHVWHQGVPGVPGSNEAMDWFGYALAAGDFDSDGADDLAIGAWGEGIGRIRAAGAVTLLYGSGTGLSAAGSATFTQDSPGVPGTAEKEDRFGFALAAGNYGRSDRDDLAIGVYREDTAGIVNAGVVDVLYGRLSGLSGKGAQSWSQASPGVKGVPARSDSFGRAVTP